MTSRTVHLGFEVGTGDAVEVPVRHMAVTGQTQESGKTTALEALITRAGLPAIAFLTKRGEGSFQNAVKVKPYFQERTDWKFVQSIIESVLRSDQQSKQSWIMRACAGAKTLADVQSRARDLEEQSKHPYVKDMYMVLAAYLDEVVPLIATLPKTNRVELHEGKLAVMDLVSYPLELQFLVIASTLQWIHKHEQGIITVIPEAWKFIPQGRNTPVRMVAENLIREGAGLKNYVWLDSQDMAGVDKVLLRGCPVWLIGIQREPNELKRALSSMPAMLKKPKPGDVAVLELGQFYACHGKSIQKTYVQPAWLDEKAARQIATGRLQVHDVRQPDTAKAKEPAYTGTVAGESPLGSPATAPDSSQLRTSALKKERPMPIAELDESSSELRQILTRAKDLVDSGGPGLAERLLKQYLEKTHTVAPSAPLPPVAITPDTNGNEPSGNEALYQAFKGRLIQEAPGIIVALTKAVPEIEVTEVREKLTMNTTTPEGRVAYLIADGFFDVNRINAEVVKELADRGWPTLAPNVGRAFGILTDKGFLVAKDKGRFVAVKGMKVNIISAVK
jgi:hypothetical protein